MSTALVTDLTIFVLALLVGIEVIGKVPATLHTPLMSAANSIHGIVLVGALLLGLTAHNAVGYILAQCAGAFAAAVVFLLIGKAPPTFAANGYGELSMIGASLFSVFLLETVLTAFFLVVIMGATNKRAPVGFAPIAIGLALSAIHLMAIPVSNASVNPARSLASAIFGGATALSQLWVFWVAPILGGVLGGALGRWLQEE